MLFYLGGRLVWDSHVGEYLPSTGELCFLCTRGSWCVQPENVGGGDGWVPRGFLVLIFQIPVPVTWEGAADRREIAGEIRIM